MQNEREGVRLSAMVNHVFLTMVRWFGVWGKFYPQTLLGRLRLRLRLNQSESTMGSCVSDGRVVVKRQPSGPSGPSVSLLTLLIFLWAKPFLFFV